MKLYELFLKEYLADKVKPFYSKFKFPVFINPDNDDWDRIFDFSGRGEYRAFLVGNDIYVWDADKSIHKVVADHFKLNNAALPIYVYPQGTSRAYILVTDMSKKTKWLHDPKTADFIRNHPYIQQQYDYVEIGYFDQDIEGDWEKLSIQEANVIGRAVRMDEIPEKYRELELLGRGATTIAFKESEDTVLLFTRDSMKKEWLAGPWGLEIEANTVDELEVLGRHKIRGMSEKPIYVIRMPLLRKLSPTNAKIVRKEMKQWQEIYSKFMSKYGHNRFGLAMQDIYNYYAENLPDSILNPILEFAVNYDESQYYMDLGLRNFMESSDGNIVVLDPLVDKEIVDLITDSKKSNRNW